MSFSRIHLLYFSPTHTSEQITRAIAEGMNLPESTEWDLTLQKPDQITPITDGVAIIATPVYGGRVPDIAIDRLRMFVANQVPAIPVVVYGNRDYEDALKELCDVVVEQGFVPVAAGAFVGEHSFSTKEMPIAYGRPDIQDIELARTFGKDCLKKWQETASLIEMPVLTVKGNFPYKEKGPANPQAPSTDAAACTQCGYCIDVCPTGAITLSEDSTYSDPAVCIKCCVCTKECPEEARSFDTPFREFLHTKFNARREPELFL